MSGTKTDASNFMERLLCLLYTVFNGSTQIRIRKNV